MKKSLLALLFWFCAISVQAQNDSLILQQIEAAGKSMRSMECQLHNQMTRSNGQTATKEGTVKYVATDKISAKFDNNEGICMNGNRMKIKLGIFNGTYRTDRGLLIKPISRMLMNAVTGQCVTMAEENNYYLEIADDSTAYIVTLTTKKRKFLGIGYKQAVFEYAKDSNRLKSILLIDYKDNRDLYSFENQIFDTEIEESVFTL